MGKYGEWADMLPMWLDLELWASARLLVLWCCQVCFVDVISMPPDLVTVLSDAAECWSVPPRCWGVRPGTGDSSRQR